MEMNEKQNYTLLGNFDLNEAKAICDVFEIQDLEFEIEINDSAIRNMFPVDAVLGGTFGRGVAANIYVDSDSLEQCNQILKEMS